MTDEWDESGPSPEAMALGRLVAFVTGVACAGSVVFLYPWIREHLPAPLPWSSSLDVEQLRAGQAASMAERGEYLSCGHSERQDRALGPPCHIVFPSAFDGSSDHVWVEVAPAPFPPTYMIFEARESQWDLATPDQAMAAPRMVP